MLKISFIPAVVVPPFYAWCAFATFSVTSFCAHCAHIRSVLIFNRPRETPFLLLAKNNNVKVIVEGIEVLLEQGFAQLQIWTGSKVVPRPQIRTVVMDSL